jgi:D-alanyl-D-alanine carboxypeptidase (penicillin-binding protein 5/6)
MATIRSRLALLAVTLFSVLLALGAPSTCLAATDAPELVEAKGAVVIDQGGNVLYSLNPELELPLASITKVMTAVVALDAGMQLDQVVTLKDATGFVEPQMVCYGDGDQVTFRELLQVMLVWSANDAAYNVAILTAGSVDAFADLMNAKAKELGMDHSHFRNPHGLDEEGHYSCAIDLARLSRYALEKYPFIANTVLMPEVSTTVRGERITLSATDWLLKQYSGIRGVKTGFVTDNYTFMGASGRGPVQLYTAVVGCTSGLGRFTDTAILMDWAYDRYDEVSLSNASWPVRLQPYAYDLLLKTAVMPNSNYVAKMWPGGGDLSYASVLARPNRLLETAKPAGWTSWSQSDRTMGRSFYDTAATPVRASSWPVFSEPLFIDTSSLKEAR